jgi:5-methyltetrahydrofolate--homocysteine methyltransferase
MPLLIGGATTSRTHTAVKIEPAYSAVDHLRHRRQPRGRRGERAVAHRARPRLEAETRAEYIRIREQFVRARRPRCARRSPQARANRFAIDWQAYAAAAPRLLGTRAFGPTTSPSSPATSTGRRSSHLGAGRHLPEDPRGRGGRRGALALRRRAGDAERIIAERWFRPRRRRLWPANATATTSSSGPTRARRARPLCTPCASRCEAARAPTWRWPTSSRPDRRRGRLRRRLRGHRRPRRAERAPSVQGRRRRLQRDPLPRRSPTGWPRPSPSAAPAQGAHRALGLCAGRGFDLEELIAERYRGIRPAPGYPGPARPHREGDALRAAGRPARRPASSSPRASP